MIHPTRLAGVILTAIYAMAMAPAAARGRAPEVPPGWSNARPMGLCPIRYEPVCGADSVRYPNTCYAKYARTQARTGGALIELAVGDESFLFWSSNAAFIAEAVEIAAGRSPQRIPLFLGLSKLPDCSQPHRFHVDPSEMEFVDATMELCDATPGNIDNNLDEWLGTVGVWCPWDARVTKVHDAR